MKKYKSTIIFIVAVIIVFYIDTELCSYLDAVFYG